MKSSSLVAVLILLVACLGSVGAQTPDQQVEIPIERCDRLPVVVVKVAGEKRRFLLDTAATTILNLRSFTSADSGQIHIYSWSGSVATSAREVFLPEVQLGTRTLRELKLPAVDLSPIGRACGGQIDGILGVDLLEQVGMTIDLRRRVALLTPTVEPGTPKTHLPRWNRRWVPASSRSIKEMCRQWPIAWIRKSFSILSMVSTVGAKKL